jgi:RimJ/RimL family protein N-acetyltransferase
VYQPLVLVRYGTDAQLDGLLLLAVNPGTGTLVFAGAHEAEYHVWLSLPGPQTFISQALQKLREMGFSSLSFSYLPPDSPLDWFDQSWERCAELRSVRRPLMQIADGKTVRQSLQKKSNKSRMSRLQRLGAVEFRQLHRPEELDEYYDDIINFTDLRQGAIHNSYPFLSNSHKRPFFRKLLSKPQLMHVTVTTVGGKLAAAHIGFVNRNQLILGIVCYSPLLSAHSPGKLHILQLALLLGEQGIVGLDLTPGDSYKERFATGSDQVYLLTLYFQWKPLLRRRIYLGIRKLLKGIASPVYLNRAVVDRIVNVGGQLREYGIVTTVLKLGRRTKLEIYSNRVLRCYRMGPREAAAVTCDLDFHKDQIAELLLYEKVNLEDRGKQQFLGNALEQFENYGHVYTYVREGRLLHYSWLSFVSGFKATDIGDRFEFPAGSVFLWDDYTHPKGRGRELHEASLRYRLRDAASAPGIEHIFIHVLAENTPSQRNIEALGFQLYATLTRRIRFGRRKWEWNFAC